MTGKQYRTAIAKLGMSQRAAAKFLSVNERTSRRWAKDGAPRHVEMILKGQERLTKLIPLAFPHATMETYIEMLSDKIEKP